MSNREYQTVESHKRRDEIQLAEDVRAVMATPAGRRLFMGMLTKSGIYTKSQPGRLEYDAGRRDAGLEALHIVNRFARVEAGLATDERDKMMADRNSELAAAKEQDRKERG